MTLTIGSLFSGIGGLELGLEWAGLGPTRWQVERDPYCRAVLAKHWPGATRHEDVRHVGRANLVPVDIICGGFPCQDISYSGLGAGLEGARSGLWYEFARIIREMGPRYVVVENVPALLTRGLDAVLGQLADCGYDAEWSCVSACAVGAAHVRDRVFVVAYPGGVGQQGPRRPEAARHPAAQGAGEAHPLEPDLRRTREPRIPRVAYGVPHRMDRLTALGNAVVPQVAEVVGRLILAREAERAHREAA